MIIDDGFLLSQDMIRNAGLRRFSTLWENLIIFFSGKIVHPDV